MFISSVYICLRGKLFSLFPCCYILTSMYLLSPSEDFVYEDKTDLLKYFCSAFNNGWKKQIVQWHMLKSCMILKQEKKKRPLFEQRGFEMFKTFYYVKRKLSRLVFCWCHDDSLQLLVFQYFCYLWFLLFLLYNGLFIQQELLITWYMYMGIDFSSWTDNDLSWCSR